MTLEYETSYSHARKCFPHHIQDDNGVDECTINLSGIVEDLVFQCKMHDVALVELLSRVAAIWKSSEIVKEIKLQ